MPSVYRLASVRIFQCRSASEGFEAHGAKQILAGARARTTAFPVDIRGGVAENAFLRICPSKEKPNMKTTRRQFMGTSAAASVALAGLANVHAQNNNDTIKIGLVGCG